MKSLERFYRDWRTKQRIASSLKVIGTFIAGVLIGSGWKDLSDLLTNLPLPSLVAGFSGVIALSGLLVQMARARFNLEIDVSMKMSDRFDKAEMRAIRAKAARGLLDDSLGEENAIETVLGYFEELGYLVRKGAIGQNTAWIFFWIWVQPYFAATKKYRSATPKVADEWAEFNFLYSVLSDEEEFARRRHPEGSSIQYGPQDVHDFLENESSLQPKMGRRRYGR